MRSLLILLASSVASLHCQAPSWSSLSEKYSSEMDNEKNPVAVLKTNQGTIILELYADAAPNTVNTIAGLANGTKDYLDPKTGNQAQGNYYDGLTFHRVIPEFMIQGGDIAGNGSGGPGFKFEDEINANALGLDKVTLEVATSYMRDLQMSLQAKLRDELFKKYNIKSQADVDKNLAKLEQDFAVLMQQAIQANSKKSVKEVLVSAGYQFNDQLPSRPMAPFSVAMANAGPNTNGSQFFINVNENGFLNGKHTNFGKVLDGKSIVIDISNVEKNQQDMPNDPVIIESFRVYFADEPAKD